MADKGSTLHFGRGGAGNITAKDAKSPVLPPAATPTLKSEHYTTGRGGTGNMAKNDPNRPEEARAAQDVDIPNVPMLDGPRSTGRGGAANIYQPTDQEGAPSKPGNDHVRSDSFTKRSGLKNVLDKGKDLLKGKSKDEKAKDNESAVAE